MSFFLTLLLPFAVFSTWYISKRSRHVEKDKSIRTLPKDYLVGLNFLLEEQPDKAVDIFIKMLEVDSDTVETHLALGSLFRRRGEVDRAIRIHQNLIARPNLDKHQRMHALLALGQDYMRAGVLDRAEKIFLELVESNEEVITSLRSLLDIYQQEKAWREAIQIANQIQQATGETKEKNIAHYYCELACEFNASHDLENANQYLRKALNIDSHCVRASIMLGEMEVMARRYRPAVEYYQQVKDQDADYLSEVISPLANCYDALGESEGFVEFLQTALSENSKISVLLPLAKNTLQKEGILAAGELVAEHLKEHPSLRGLQFLIELYLVQAEEKFRDSLINFNEIVLRLLRNKPIYRCQQCGFSTKTILWLCPGCKSWSTVKPINGIEAQ